MKYGQLILRKIIKIVATRCQILKCTEIDFGMGLRPRPRWRSLQRTPDLLAWIKGPTSKGGEEDRDRKGRRRKGKQGREKELRETEERGLEGGGEDPLVYL